MVMEKMIAFGPIPSRRLGFSLGINHIPPKYCSYSCIYCQVGRTDHLIITPREFYSVESIVQSVEQKIREAQSKNQPIDYLSFVPDGEPTLDINLGKEIKALKHFGYPIAVISNASLINLPQVREALAEADWVSLKIDSVSEEIWHKVNRPNKRLKLENILKGAIDFSKEYSGELVTETMLIEGINDDIESTKRLADFLCELKPKKTYLLGPVRPPAENWIFPPDSETLKKICQIVSASVPLTICLFDSEKKPFTATGDITADILGITAVHPIRESALRKMVEQAGADWSIVEKLVEEKQLKKQVHLNEIFYRRNLDSI